MNTVTAVDERNSDPAEIDPVDARPVPHPGRWVAAAVVLLLGAMIVKGAATSANMHWGVVWQYLTYPTVLQGLALTLELTVVSMAVGVGLGLILAAMRLSPNPLLRYASFLYSWIFRGTPLLVQLLFWYFLAAVLPTVGFGIPFGPTFISWSTNSLITKFAAAVLGLGLNEAAFSAEIIRAGLISVDHGQREAADALGLSRLQQLRKVIIPQAMRFIIPPLGNDIISMVKNTSLVLVIALPELLTTVQNIYARNFLQIPLLMVACIWYLIIFTVLSVAQYYVERHFGRGHKRTVQTQRGKMPGGAIFSALGRRTTLRPPNPEGMK